MRATTSISLATIGILRADLQSGPHSLLSMLVCKGGRLWLGSCKSAFL